MGKRFKHLKRISPEEASRYISVNDDLNNSFIRFYTVEPSYDPNCHFDQGWEDVIYYTARRKPKIRLINEEALHDEGYIQIGEGPNTVYIMSNPSMPDLLKIGSTRGLIEDRRKQLSRASGVPAPFKIECVFKIDGNEEHLEREVHNYLEHKRSNMNREFFDVSLNDAIEAIKKVGEKYI